MAGCEGLFAGGGNLNFSRLGAALALVLFPTPFHEADAEGWVCGSLTPIGGQILMNCYAVRGNKLVWEPPIGFDECQTRMFEFRT